MFRIRSARGVSESVQWAVMLPALLLGVLGLIQTGVWLHGRQVVATAAAAAAEAEAVSQAGSGAGERAAVVVAGGSVTNLHVTVVRSTSQVRVVVTGRVPTFFDVGQGEISTQATAPLEVTTR